MNSMPLKTKPVTAIPVSVALPNFNELLYMRTVYRELCASTSAERRTAFVDRYSRRPCWTAADHQPGRQIPQRRKNSLKKHLSLSRRRGFTSFFVQVGM